MLFFQHFQKLKVNHKLAIHVLFLLFPFSSILHAKQCNFNIMPSSNSVPQEGGTGMFSVTSSCTWYPVIQTGTGWLYFGKIEGEGLPPYGNGTVTYIAEANNTGKPRKEYIRVVEQDLVPQPEESEEIVFTLEQTEVPSGMIVSVPGSGPVIGTIGMNCTTVNEIPVTECEVLVNLYNSTHGSGWISNTGWNSTNTPCSWFGISCNNGHVTQINLSYNQLSGVIPPELGNLSNLQGLDLSYNQLSGNIPPKLGSLSNLQYLNLGANHQLSGIIPSEFGNLSNLQGLYLYSIYQLIGAIPAELGKLSNLQFLNLSDNQLSGTIPTELGKLSNLQRLDLAHNQLSGNIPTELGNLSNLQDLNLNTN